MAKKKSYQTPYPMPPEQADRFKGAKIMNMNDAPEEFKISARFVNLARPWYTRIKTSLLADLVAVAWNEVVKEDFGEDYKLDLNNPSESINEHRAIVNDIKVLKRKLYPNDARGIRGTFIRVADDGEEKINVVSDMPPDAVDGVFMDIGSNDVIPITEDMLCDEIKKSLPVFGYVSRHLANNTQEARKLRGKRLEVIDAVNSGEMGGVLLRLKNAPIVCSATHLVFRDEGELYDMLRSYQESRKQWLSSQS